ncbi:MAG: signal recognition particle-docking protein FtsY [Proteobacteria bacterium]|nr:signal recognition particle-docking protein FtsY [Pseudomonadota bacterium]
MDNSTLEYLQNAGNHEKSWILIYGPLAIGAFLAVLFILLIYLKRRRDGAELEKEYTQKSSKPGDSKTDEVGTSVPKQDHLGLRDSEPKPEDSKISEESWVSRLAAGLARTKESLTGGLKSLFGTPVKLDSAILEKIHEHLYRSDIGVKTADRLIEGLKEDLTSSDTHAWPDIKRSLISQCEKIFQETKSHTSSYESAKPYVILIVGVNGVGKTTTIGKLALHFKNMGKTVLLCAADTFRAAAVEQLQIWGDRNDIAVIKHGAGADPAAVAYDAVKAAKARNIDILLIDTAGRLHSKTELMAELNKINRSIGKDLIGAPHDTWIVLDATTGQNAVIQCKSFNEVTKLSGIIMTKLDGTAKGGVVIGIADQFKMPIKFIGVGEKADDLREFNEVEFTKGLFD